MTDKETEEQIEKWFCRGEQAAREDIEKIEGSKPIEGVGKIYELMAKAMADVKPVAKSGENKDQNYAFRKSEDIYGVCQAALSKHGITIWPKPLRVSRNAVVSRKGAKGFHVVADYRMRFRAPDGSFDDYFVTGESTDWSDKVSNKVITFAMKNCLLAAFLIPTALLDDGDRDHPEIVAPPRPSTTQPRTHQNATAQPPKGKGTTKPTDPVTTPQLKALHTMTTKKGFKAEDIKEALKSIFDYESSKQLSQKQYSDFFNLIKGTDDFSVIQIAMLDALESKQETAEQQKKTDVENPVEKQLKNHAPSASNTAPPTDTKEALQK